MIFCLHASAVSCETVEEMTRCYLCSTYKDEKLFLLELGKRYIGETILIVFCMVDES